MKKKSKNYIKGFQIDAVRQFGNTIVDKKMKPEDIVSEFKKQGFDVEVREFTSNGNGYTKDSHYVVKKI